MWTIGTTAVCAVEIICAKRICCDTFDTNASESRHNSTVIFVRPNTDEKRIWCVTHVQSTNPLRWNRNRKCLMCYRIDRHRHRRRHRRRRRRRRPRPSHNLFVIFVRPSIGAKMIWRDTPASNTKRSKWNKNRKCLIFCQPLRRHRRWHR